MIFGNGLKKFDFSDKIWMVEPNSWLKKNEKTNGRFDSLLGD